MRLAVFARFALVGLTLVGLLALVGCETPVRPTPPDTGPDARLDAPEVADVGACVEVAGFYLGSSTCPGLGGGAFGACVARTGCDAEVFLASGGLPATFSLEGAWGTFEVGALAPEITCTEASVDDERLRFACVDRLGIGCEVTLMRRETALGGLCCLDDAACATGAACTLVELGGGPPVTTACIERDGEQQAGEPCARLASGDDDCAAGLYCTGAGEVGGALACRPLCREAADCGAAEACIATGTAPAMGFCGDRCDVFAADGCGAARGCVPTEVYPTVGERALAATCIEAGTGALGELCELDGCIAGLLCARTAALELRCAAPCDELHPCADGECAPFEGETLGTCQ